MGSTFGAIYGAQQAAAEAGRGNKARQQALENYNAINIPDIEKQQLNFQNYQNAGDYQTQLENALQLGPSEMGGIQTDPRLAQAQMSALQQLSQTGQMGMTPAEAAALASANRAAQSQAQAKSEQILDQFARRGMGGSGAELAAQLQNAQSSADRASQQGGEIAQNAQQNALSALSQAGQLGGQMQAQQFGQQSDVARAKDYINQFNLANAQNVQGKNVSATNQAALQNLMQHQNIMNMNTQLANQQQQYNKELLQQQYSNQMAKAKAQAGQYEGIAEARQKNAGNVANMWAGVGQGVDTAAGGIYNAYQNKPQQTQQQPATSNYGNYGGQQSSGGYAGFSPAEEDSWLDYGISSDQGF